MFMKNLELDWKIYSFNKCDNFVILPGIISKYKKGADITVKDNTGLMKYDMQILSIDYYRFCDIPNFTHWHMHRILKLNGFIKANNIWGDDKQIKDYASKILKYLYGKCDEDAIMTVITIRSKQYCIGYDNSDSIDFLKKMLI